MQKDNDFLMMNKIIGDLGSRGIGNRPSKRKTFFTITLLKLVKDIQNKTINEFIESSDELQEQGVKINIPSNKIDVYCR